MSSGTYMLRAGQSFYIGSSRNFRKRRYNHKSDLLKSRHPNKKIQAAFDAHGSAEFIPIEFIRPMKNEENQAFSSRLRSAEQRVLDGYLGDPDLCNSSPSAFGPDNGDLIKAKWRDAHYREAISSKLRGRKPNSETRERMSASKRGAKNGKSKAAIVTAPDGTETRFDCVSDAAKFFGVSQQLLDSWLKGVVAWPGTGRRTLDRNKWIADYSAIYESPNL